MHALLLTLFHADENKICASSAVLCCAVLCYWPSAQAGETNSQDKKKTPSNSRRGLKIEEETEMSGFLNRKIQEREGWGLTTTRLDCCRN